MIDLIPARIVERMKRLDLSLQPVPEIPELGALLGQSVLAGGKRLRPMLCLLMGDLLGISHDVLEPYARIAEIMHAASLAHDDVIDDASTRRGRPTLPRLTCNARAVLAGDWLLSKVVSDTAALGNLRLVREVSLVLSELVSGEWLQIGRKGKADVPLSLLEGIAERKTGSLMSWCCLVPAVVGGYPEGVVQLCRDYGKLAGLAFQMADDIIDFQRESGKPYCQDLREGLLNFVGLALCERFPALIPAMEGQMRGFDDTTVPWNADQLETALGTVVERLQRHLSVALGALERIAEQSGRKDSPNADDALRSLQRMTVFIGARTSIEGVAAA